MKDTDQNEIRWYETMTFKMALLGIMAIMFLVPLQLIQSMIAERAENSRLVQQQISEEWGKKQIITGPVLNIPVSRVNRLSDDKEERETLLWHIMPGELNVSGLVEPRVRYKGIYETVIYEADMTFRGFFRIPELTGDKSDYEIMWSEAYYTLGISDNRGIKDSISLLAGNAHISAEPGARDKDVFTSGVTFPAFINKDSGRIPFSLDLGLKGSSGIFFSPVGKKTTVDLSSSWTAPSFTGNFLPDERTVDDDGFEAKWNITHLNRNFPLTWFGKIHDPEQESFGFDMILEVDHYRKAERSAKYGLLFIAFTFLVLLFLELSANRKIHLFHYFLVSLSLVLFFSLLTSLSEHIGFSPAYIVSSVATIGLLSAFSRSLFKKRKFVLIISGMLTLLYAFIYILLALNEFAYLAGNIGLFVGLAVLMWMSSRMNLFGRSSI
ncbi:MAG: cell envelope integrity protein CreD [Bacteroidales bacterium]|nr:cell envelope integrity protein CreD [Bacteroidales bacterium]